MTTYDLVPIGPALQLIAGEIPPPSQVFSRLRNPDESALALVTESEEIDFLTAVVDVMLGVVFTVKRNKIVLSNFKSEPQINFALGDHSISL